MKELFPGHFFSTVNFGDALKEALIVFDTNVLINFYDWGATTRKNQFERLRKVQDRCWIPFHVALEFHRSRPNRVESALKHHRDLIKKVTTGIDDLATSIAARDVFNKNPETDKLLKEFREAGGALVDHANQAIKDLPQTSNEDPVNDFLAELFEGRVGSPPLSQDAIEEINKRGKRRYESNHPPGVTDSNKDGQKYMDREIMYSGMYGDLYIWMQVLDFLPKVAEKKHLIFVTDERKADWWAKGETGQFNPVPAPELSQELALKAPGWQLSMYSSPDFFKLLTASLGMQLSPAELAEITEAADSQFEGPMPSPLEQALSSKQLIKIYENWIAGRHGVSSNEVSHMYAHGRIDFWTMQQPSFHYHVKILYPKDILFPFEVLSFSPDGADIPQARRNLIIDVSRLDDEQSDRILKVLANHSKQLRQMGKELAGVFLGSAQTDGTLQTHLLA